MEENNQDAFDRIGEAAFETTAVAGVPIDYEGPDAGEANVLNTYVRLDRVEIKDSKIKAVFNCQVRGGLSSFGMNAEKVVQTARNLKKIAEDMEDHPLRYNAKQFALAASLCLLGGDVIERNGGISAAQVGYLQGDGSMMHSTQKFFSSLQR